MILFFPDHSILMHPLTSQTSLRSLFSIQPYLLSAEESRQGPLQMHPLNRSDGPDGLAFSSRSSSCAPSVCLPHF